MVRFAVLVSLVLAGSCQQPPTVADLQRAKTKKPRDVYRGEDQTALSKVLNGHLRRSERLAKACAEWSPEELQVFMAAVADERHDELQAIYAATKDRRQLRLGTLEEYRQHWGKMNLIVANHPHLLDPLRESHCREAVMWWTHHLTEEKRVSLRARNLTVPLLPEGPKMPCGRGEGHDEHQACLKINEPNSCDWCHSTQASHDANEPGTTPPDALQKKTGPDDGNPHAWDRQRRCDQDQVPRCQMCEGIGGEAYADKNEAIHMTPCMPLATPEELRANNASVAPPLYPKKFTIKRKDGKAGGYSDTLIGWKTDPFCFGFFPQNDSHGELCYRSEEATAKYYDIEREAVRSDYNIKLSGAFGIFGNITSTILMANETMWVQNHLYFGLNQCICTNPSGNHCSNPPCKAYAWHWDTFKTAQHLGRERIGVEWIQDHGVGQSSKMMDLDHFILWSHHVWTDPVSKRLVRAWKPFNGLQVYDPEAWIDDVEDQSVFDNPPALCKKGGAKIRINCDDDGHYKPKHVEGLEHLEALFEKAKAAQEAQIVI
eukprot:TRINITY_DN1068_c0_g1_i1.p1 TRINITY_DN1068_c0_g1~~TRINITY_DN1068_c0_g1_i1.p1  ORF type:complete len:561 (-),score=109.03 TRINITY_DN1068_c0_g1_i1:126-1757(-)